MTVKRLDFVHRHFRLCNVLHIWTIRAIPTMFVIHRRKIDYKCNRRILGKIQESIEVFIGNFRCHVSLKAVHV